VKKLLISIVLVLVALAGAVIAAPNFIDWNKYRDEITTRVKDATGQDIEIRGDIKIAILPSPALVVEDVHVANVEGASDADIVSLGSLEVHVALAPLLNKNLQVTRVKLVRPVVNLEIFTKDRANFDSFTNPPAKPATGAVTPPAGPASSGNTSATGLPADVGGFALRVDSFVVENGSLNYRDRTSGQVEQVKSLNGQFRMASLNGPMDAEGSVVVRGIPLSFSADIGEVVQKRTLPFRLAVTVIPGDVKTRFNGAVSGIDKSLRLKGNLAIDGANLREFVAGVADGAALPDMLAKPFSLLANVAATEKLAEVSGLGFELNGSKGTGRVSLEMGKTIDLDVGLTLNKFDLDRLLAPAPAAPKSETQSQVSTSADKGQASLSLGDRPSAVKPTSGPAGLAALPANLSAKVNLGIEALTYKGQAIRQAKFNADLSNRELTLNQVSALLPGNSDLALFGFVSQNGDIPKFDGSVDFSTNDLRALLDWAGVKVDGIASDYLRKLSIAAKVTGNPDSVSLTEIQSQADNTKLTGAATVALRARPSIGANIAIDRVNLDAYLPKSSAPASASSSKPSPSPSASGAQPDKPATAAPAANPLTPLGALGGIDFNLKAKLGSLTFQDQRVTGINVESTLVNGDLTFKDWTVRNFAGVSAKVKGGITGLRSAGVPADPAFKDFNISLSGKSLVRLFKISGVTPPVSPAKLGPVSVSTTLNGKPAELRLATLVDATGGEFSMNGTASGLTGLPAFEGQVRLTHKDFNRVLSLLNVDYRPASGKFGPIDVAGKISANPGGVAMTSLAGEAAGVKFAGDAGVQWLGARPEITADLKTGAVNINRLLPRTNSDKRSSATRNTASSSTRKSSRASAPAGRSRWSTEPIDLSALTTFDANVGLSSSKVIYDKASVDNLILSGVLKNGILDVRRLTGKMFGGDVKMDAKVIASRGSGQYQTRFSVSRLNVPTALTAYGNTSLKSGTMELVGDFRTSGRSQADMIAALNGNGSLALTNIDVSSGAAKGSSFSGVTSLLGSLYGFARKLGGKTGRDVADLRGSFLVDKGIASFDDLTLVSGIGNGSAKGVVDLPNWQTNTSGQLQLSDSLVLQLLTKSSGPRLIPFQVSGRMDAPNVKLDTSAFAGGIRVPGVLDKKIEKLTKKKGVGKVLEKIFPGAQPSPAPTQSGSTGGAPPPQQPSPQEPSQQKTRPEDVLKGILRGLTR
jgi:uncharacterized protein involved in outer membrane biogenesis